MDIQASRLILASQSPNRKLLLERLHVPFECLPSDIDESPQPGETAEELVSRLSYEKALHQAHPNAEAIVIGSDQVACLDGKIYGKPHTYDNTVKQLLSFSGKAVTFYTGVCILKQNTQYRKEFIETYTTTFRPLTKELVEHYLKKEQPFKCAGALMSEGYGVTLLSKMEGNDPTALLGLPLIKVTSALKELGLME